jgi:hypothetical protein
MEPSKRFAHGLAVILSGAGFNGCSDVSFWDTGSNFCLSDRFDFVGHERNDFFFLGTSTFENTIESFLPLGTYGRGDV